MPLVLIVTHPVPGHETGERITEPDTVERLLDSHPHHVVKVGEEPAAPATPPPATLN